MRRRLRLAPSTFRLLLWVSTVKKYLPPCLNYGYPFRLQRISCTITEEAASTARAEVTRANSHRLGPYRCCTACSCSRGHCSTSNRTHNNYSSIVLSFPLYIAGGIEWNGEEREPPPGCWPFEGFITSAGINHAGHFNVLICI